MLAHLCCAIVGNPHVTMYVICTAHVIHAVHIFKTMSESYMVICCALRLLFIIGVSVILVCCALHCSELSSEEN